MKTSAQALSLLILVISYGGFIAGLSDVAALGVGGIVGALLVPLAVTAPFLPALMAIDNNRPRLEKAALVLNQIALFLVLSVTVGFAGKYQSIDAILPYLPFVLLFGGACYLNIAVIRRQIKSRP